MDEMLADGDSSNIIHSFTGTLVLQGEGTSITGAFLNEISTLISIMVHDDPSPVWYEVVDSSQICGKENWIDTVISEVTIVYWRSLLSTHAHTHTHTHTHTHSPPHTQALPHDLSRNIRVFRSNLPLTNFNRKARHDNELGHARIMGD